MSEQALDLRRSLRIVWRHKIVVGLFAAAGLTAGVLLTVHSPPLLTSESLVLLPPQVHETRTQTVLATIDPVLAPAVKSVDPKLSIAALRKRIRVGAPSYNLISIGAQGATAAQAERTANAVADSYVHYIRSGGPSGRAIPATIVSPAMEATGTPMAVRLLDTAGPGLLLGVLAGAVLALAISRSDRRLRRRDEIADCIGSPVLASITVDRPASAAHWARLLQDYEPGAVDAWRLRKALEHLDLSDGDGDGYSLAVLSLSSDSKALALGPQLAAFAASLGIATVLVVGLQQDPNATATLRAACGAPPTQSAPSRRLRSLRLSVSDHNTSPLPGAGLTIVVAVVDGQDPKVASTMRASATVLGVSAGAATAEELARVASSAAADGRHIAGVLVADPDPADHTTGRLPQLGRSRQRRLPTRMTGTAAETRQ